MKRFSFTDKSPYTGKPPKGMPDPRKDLGKKKINLGREDFDPDHIVTNEEGGNEDILDLYEKGAF